MRCTGPYTRVLFDTSDAKPARALVEMLRAQGLELTERHVPEGTRGLDDFALDVDFPAADGSGVWEVRCAKYLGPKKFLGQGYVYDAGLRRRAPGGENAFDGHVFATSLKALNTRLAAALPGVLAGHPSEDVLEGDDAELHRIELCTGEA